MAKTNQIDAKYIIDKFQTEDDRTKTSLYLSKRVYKEFKKVCGNASPSKVLEELMKKFVEDAK